MSYGSIWSDIVDRDIFVLDEQSAADWLEEHGDAEYRSAVEVEDLREKLDHLVWTVRHVAEELAFNGHPSGDDLLEALKEADFNG